MPELPVNLKREREKKQKGISGRRVKRGIKIAVIRIIMILIIKIKIIIIIIIIIIRIIILIIRIIRKKKFAFGPFG